MCNRYRIKATSFVRWLITAVTGGLLAACTSPLTVEELTPPRSVSEASWRSHFGLDTQSEKVCRELIRRRQLGETMEKSPESALGVLRQFQHDLKPTELQVLATLLLNYGEVVQNEQPAKAVAMDLAAAAAVYPLLSSPDGTMARNPLAVSTYDRAVENAVLLVQTLPGKMLVAHDASACGTSFHLTVVASDRGSDLQSYDEWLPADRWIEHGLNHRYRNEGIGARLIAIRTRTPVSSLEKHEPDEGYFQPCTALLRFAERKAQTPSQKVSLELYHPAITATTRLAGRSCLLAADFSMPWAMLGSHATALNNTKWSAMVRPGDTARPHRLYLMEPYSPNRIPVIMVHGLYSTPVAWKQMTNELMGDPEIRKHYQIWHYLYPTGLPFLTSAADFRDEIEEVRQLVAPDKPDFATQNMVVIAHSMGGLLTRTLVTESGDALWNVTFSIPISKMAQNTPEFSELRRTFYFHPKPYIKRVIYLSVPHRGSNLAASPLGRYVSAQVRLPSELQMSMTSMSERYPGLLTPETATLFQKGYPNSIQVLAPGTPGLQALAKLPESPSAPFHSIMGDRGKGGDKENSSDGVVPYSSSHLSGAVSEKFVPSDHGTIQNQEAIDEVKRILLAHLKGLDS